MLNDKQKDEIIKLAQEISKYAFALAFFSSYSKSDAEKHHCRENLKRITEELIRLSKE